MFTIRRTIALAAVVVSAGSVVAAPAFACGGLVDPNGTIRLSRTSTLATYANGVEHYVTAFAYDGGGGSFGSIVPLPARPTKVEKAGDWTLQRLSREVAPPVLPSAAARFENAASDAAEVILQAKIDALDITVLKGGGPSVRQWAKENDFRLSSDAPKMLDFYARRSPYFMAARFDVDRAAERGQVAGQGTPVHVEIPVDAPWVPLHILSLGKSRSETVSADVFLLTDREPALLGGIGTAVQRVQSRPAGDSLLRDLRSDKASSYIPEKAWFTYLRIDAAASDLSFDLAIDASGKGKPSRAKAGLTLPKSLRFPFGA